MTRQDVQIRESFEPDRHAPDELLLPSGGEAATTPRLSLIWPGPDRLGESPRWNPRDASLWWVDSFAPAIRRLDTRTGQVTIFEMPADIGSFVFAHDGSLVAATRAGFLRVDIDGDTLHTRTIADPLARNRRLMLNDGRCDQRGRYWCASVHSDFVGRSAELLRLDPDGTVSLIETGFVIGNGIAISPDNRRFYLADSRDEIVWVWDFDLDAGRLSHKRPFFSTAAIDGRVDGAACDTEGNYWCALVHGAAIACISPDGRLIRRIEVPTRHPTMVCFGGQHLESLFVTSAAQLLDPAERPAWPQAGGLFRIDGCGARGLPEPLYGLS